MAANGNQPFVIDDRETGLFRVHRSAFTDPEVLTREQRRIFDQCWLYVGHESEVSKPGDFITRRVAGRPIIMARGNDGKIRVLLNTCTHRGAMVCRHKEGNAKTFQCFYHAWTFDNQGKLVGVPGEDAYGPGFDRNELALGQPARTESYKGLVFTSFNADLPPLPEYLAGARDYIDLWYDQGEPEGLEVVSGSQEYCMHANWKLLIENSYDGYHALATHNRYFTQLLPDLGMENPVRGQSYVEFGKGCNLGNGHALQEGRVWRTMDEDMRPVWEARHGRERAAQMVDDSHNMLVFPNLIMINMWRTLRTFYPIAPNLVEINVWALMPRRDSRETRRGRLDHFLSFLGPGGFATPDDAEALECCQRGFATNREVQWSDISRGVMREDSKPSGSDELQMRTFWRRWNQLLTA